MFGSEILEVAIGLILMFLLFSLIMAAARETVESVLKSRANNLQKALAELLGPQGGGIGGGIGSATPGQADQVKGALTAFQAHPLIYALYQGGTVKPGLGTNAPSYIPPMAFATAVMDLAAAGQKLPADSAAARAYALFAQQAGASAEQVKAELAAWYDNSMDRASGWYRRHTQWFLFLGGLIFAVALNLNAVIIAQHLSVDQTARESLVRIATTTAPPQQALGEVDLRKLDDAVRRTGLPIGWGAAVWPSLPRAAGGEGGIGLAELLIGYLAFALAATLGAPFWFDLLSKVIAIRSTMKPETAQSSTAPSPAPSPAPAPSTPEVARGPVPDRLTAPPQPFVYG
ncbi:MAG: hypothetical protein K5Q68_14055 [Roseococcus sp.]|nr:hypothetical protein [Roseococcus sp.]